MDKSEEEFENQNSIIGSVFVKVIFVLFVILVLVVSFIIYKVKQEFASKKHTDQETVLTHIESDRGLKKHWERIQTFTDLGKIETMESQTAMMMGGASLYVKCRFTAEKLAAINDRLSQIPGKKFNNGKYSGTKYSLEESGYDGPALSIIIDDKDPGVIHFESYAGDG